MSNVLEQKKQLVADIATKLRDASSAVIVDYRGLNVAQVTELRKQLREAGVEYKVYKNTLIRRATAEADLTGLDEHLVGPTAIAFGTEDVITPAKVINEFAKKNDALEIKVGVIEGNVSTAAEVKALAELPSRDGLLSMLANVLQAPVRGFAIATKAVADQKEEQGA
ncbi:50S ribosomal protein L10 [Shouchella shacheensis]|uniref:50S ribosomal protein L10 n=1 Tax=Shouchella shacheensis TaxID=1649580 RepID=UPI00073FBFE3|nr:50S ribosomal protein L10 [Shouchella shacheensis]